jgi:hypothetical protein
MIRNMEISSTVSIIAAGSPFLLKRYLKNNRKNKGYYMSFSTLPPDVAELLAGHGIESISPAAPSTDRQEAVLRDYIEVVGRLGEWNGHVPQWWVTDIVSKNAYWSPLLQPLNELIRCLDAIDTVKGTKDPLFIVHPSRPTLAALRQAASNNGWYLRTLLWPWSGMISRLLGKKRTWVLIFRSALGTLREIARANRSFGSKFGPTEKDGPVYLIKSFVYPDAFKNDGSYQDPFFGRLAEYLAEELSGKARVMTVALGFNLKQECYRKMRDLKGAAVVPLESMMRYRDVIKCLCCLIWMAIVHPFKVKGKVVFLGCDIVELLSELLSSGGWHISFFHYMHYAAGEKLAKDHNIIACALTYEGNPWERAFIAGIKKSNAKTRMIGYQHTVIPQAAANMFQSPREINRIPLPDIVLTTGEVPADILQKHGAFPKERIKISCALRFQYLDEMQVQPRRRPDSQGTIRVLVALCGVKETLPLLRYAIDQACSVKHIDFLIRAHPVLPFEQLRLWIDDIDMLPSNMKISNGTTVMEDIMASDSVLYWGSSVALEGIRMGKPVIHFNQDDFLSYDPLFDLKEFKWVINSKDNILDVLGQIDNIPDHAFEELRDRAHRYVVSYHNPVSREAMSPFLLLRN